MEAFLLFFGVFLSLGVIVFEMFRRISKKNRFRKWALHNNLRCLKKQKIGLQLFDNTIITNVIWGEYEHVPVYIFTLVDANGRHAKTKTFFNGNFYSELCSEEVEKHLKNIPTTLRIVQHDPFIEDIEMVQLLSAYLFLNIHKEVAYPTVKKIWKSFRKYLSEHTKSISGRMAGGLGAYLESGIHFSDPVALVQVMRENPGVPEEVVKETGRIYEDLLFGRLLGMGGVQQGPVLAEIDMKKFR